MRHISMSQLGRGAVPAGHLAADHVPHRPAPSCAIDKWSLSKAAVDARAHLGVTDRDLAVLAALLSFHPSTELAEESLLTVFPSNATLSARLHGMPESTMRRHLAALVRAQLIHRRDSPNGKRYARRSGDGKIDRAFGFDLRPLLHRAGEIFAAAEQSRAEAIQMRYVREEISLALRECVRVMALLGPSCPTESALSEQLVSSQRHFRRKLSLHQLQSLCHETHVLLSKLTAHLPTPPDHMSANGSQNERHYQDSDQNDSESESSEKMQEDHAAQNGLALEHVLMAAPDVLAYSRHPIRSWRDLMEVSAFVVPMLGITMDVWSEARKQLGDDAASVAIACILQQADRIRRPGAYLRVLVRKAVSASFNAAAMVESLLFRQRVQGFELTAVNQIPRR